ncbi:helix-turn-helix domain-containing protein [Catenulispora pinisilvae]|uniref:helix-turn-helix domain-containing protein n=1 Tax=Catenulispora pinisilvae TaxID=2705253 RepID=UPI001890BE19
MSSRSRTLHVDSEAERTFARIIRSLRSARLDAGLSQNALSAGLPVRGRAISEWETGAIEPTLEHLIQCGGELHLRLVITGWDGKLCKAPWRQRSGETWEHFERRRLATPLRERRVALGMSQGELGELVGVSRDSVQRWELVRVPPRPISHIVWAQKLGYSLALRPVDVPDRRPRRLATDRAAAPAGQHERQPWRL